jgi:hypothetical protein
MRRSRFRKFVIPVVVLVVIAAVGAASTNAISFTNTDGYKNIGYGSFTTQSTVAVSDVHYTTDTTGQTLQSVEVTFGAVLQATDDVSIAFNGGDTSPCIDSGDHTTYNCAVSEPVTTETDIDFAVTPND